jgi:autotransporter passenger strand-loop-strand repeat protein
VPVSSGGILELLSGNTTSGITLLAGATLEVTSGAVLSGQTVSKGVTVVVLSGSTAESLNVKAGGVEIISAGGFESGQQHQLRRYLRNDRECQCYPALAQRSCF